MQKRAARAIASFALVVSAVSPVASHAQGLRDKISELFIFGPGENPLFLAGSGDPNNPVNLQAHGSHFVPSSAAGNFAVIQFITDALASNVSNMPIGSTSGAETFRFVAGVPTRTSTSAGPIFAERPQTLGRGRILAGVNRSSFRFATLRGVDMKNINLTFTHQNVDFTGCSAAFGGDCAKYGVPGFENDVMEFKLAIDLHVLVNSMYATYGVTDRLDVGVVIPVVQARMDGSSFAQMHPFGGTTANHYFSGTATNPVLSADRTTSGTATGLGDVALRIKQNLRETPKTALSFLVDARFPTGSEKDLLGSGKFTGRTLFVLGSRYGDFSPHANVGYLYRAAKDENDMVLGTVGFDHRLSDAITLAADLVSELQVGDSKLHLPETVNFELPFRRSLNPTEIPDVRDDIVNGSFGFKLIPKRNVTLVLNTLFPLNSGGLRPDIVYTGGIEYSF